MASKRAVKGVKKLTQIKIDHPPYLKTNIPAGKATPSPPLGPQMGQRGIQIGPLVKQFNDLTKDYKPGIPLPTLIKCNVLFSVVLDKEEAFSYISHIAATIA